MNPARKHNAPRVDSTVWENYRIRKEARAYARQVTATACGFGAGLLLVGSLVAGWHGLRSVSAFLFFAAMPFVVGGVHNLRRSE